MLKRKGFTEPDPREDLSGNDVKRKLLILARESGEKIHDSDISIKPFVSEKSMAADSVDSFFDVLKEDDASFSEYAKEVEDRGNRLRFIASYENGKGEISLTEVEPSNLSMYWTEAITWSPSTLNGMLTHLL